MYAASGRPSIAPEYVLRALLLQAFYSVRSERRLVEQLDYNLLFRWFVGLGMDDAVWNHAVHWVLWASRRSLRATTVLSPSCWAAAKARAAHGSLADECRVLKRDMELAMLDALVTEARRDANNVEDWDALAHINLVTVVGKHFKIKFALGELQELKTWVECAI